MRLLALLAQGLYIGHSLLFSPFTPGKSLIDTLLQATTDNVHLLFRHDSQDLYTHTGKYNS